MHYVSLEAEEWSESLPVKSKMANGTQIGHIWIALIPLKFSTWVHSVCAVPVSRTTGATGGFKWKCSANCQTYLNTFYFASVLTYLSGRRSDVYHIGRTWFFTQTSRPPQSWAPAGMGKRGHLPPSGNVVKSFVHCKTLSRRIIYALFSQPVVSASGGFAPTPPPGLHSWAPAGERSSPNP